MAKQNHMVKAIDERGALGTKAAGYMHGEVVDPPVIIEIMGQPVGVAMRRVGRAWSVQTRWKVPAASQRLGPAYHGCAHRLGHPEGTRHLWERFTFKPPQSQVPLDCRSVDSAGRLAVGHPILSGRI